MLRQRKLLAARAGERAAFWRKALAGAPTDPALPTDRPRGAADGSGGWLPLEIPADLHAGLAALARRRNCTVFMTVHAALAALLTRAGAGSDVTIGTAVVGRPDSAPEDLVGFFANTLVLRCDTSGNPSMTELLVRVREADLEFLTCQDTPFDQVVEAVAPPRSRAHHPLFQVLLAFQVEPPRLPEVPGLTVVHRELATGTSKFDLTFTLTEQSESGGGPGGITGGIEYAADLSTRRRPAGWRTACSRWCGRRWSSRTRPSGLWSSATGPPGTGRRPRTERARTLPYATASAPGPAPSTGADRGGRQAG
ncbi:condensation domain-containing protein [Streptomyces nigrescens]